MVSCHNDGDRKNNRLSNLRYDTQKSNINDRREHGTISVNKGDANGMAKLDEQKVREMKIIRKTTGVSHSKLGKQYGVSREQARDICNGKCWAHVSI